MPERHRFRVLPLLAFAVLVALGTSVLSANRAGAQIADQAPVADNSPTLIAGTVYDSVTHRGDGVKYASLDEQQLAMPRPEEIAVMEVYNGAATVPAQFSGMNACGVVVIWTGQ